MLELLNVMFWVCMFGCGAMIGLLWNDKELNKERMKNTILENHVDELNQDNYRSAQHFEEKIDDLHKEIDRLHRKYGD